MPASDPDPCLHRLLAGQRDLTVQTIDTEFGDLFASGETGLTGIVADPDFTSNRRFYTCQGHTGPEMQVIAWSINASSRRSSVS